jgi:hypothetical protein
MREISDANRKAGEIEKRDKEEVYTERAEQKSAEGGLKRGENGGVKGPSEKVEEGEPRLTLNYKTGRL